MYDIKFSTTDFIESSVNYYFCLCKLMKLHTGVNKPVNIKELKDLIIFMSFALRDYYCLFVVVVVVDKISQS